MQPIRPPLNHDCKPLLTVEAYDDEEIWGEEARVRDAEELFGPEDDDHGKDEPMEQDQVSENMLEIPEESQAIVAGGTPIVPEPRGMKGFQRPSTLQSSRRQRRSRSTT